MSKVKFPEAEFNALASALMGIDRRKLHKLVTEWVEQLNEFKEWAHAKGWHIRRRRDMLEFRDSVFPDWWFKVFNISEAHNFISRLDDPAEIRKMFRYGLGVDASEALCIELVERSVLNVTNVMKETANATDACDAEVVKLVIPRRARDSAGG